MPQIFMYNFYKLFWIEMLFLNYWKLYHMPVKTYAKNIIQKNLLNRGEIGDTIIYIFLLTHHVFNILWDWEFRKGWNLAQFHCNMQDDALVQWISNFAPPCCVRDLHFYKEATNIFVTATKKGFLSTGKRKRRKITSFSRLLRLLLLHLPSLRFPRKVDSSYSTTTGLRISK